MYPVYIGSLPAHTTVEDIVRLMHNHGYMRFRFKKKDKEFKKRFVVLIFFEETDYRSILQKNINYKGFDLKIEAYRSGDEKKMHDYTIAQRRIHFSTSFNGITNSIAEEIFREYGEIESAYVRKGVDNSNYFRYGFATFIEKEVARYLIEKRTIYYKDVLLQIKPFRQSKSFDPRYSNLGGDQDPQRENNNNMNGNYNGYISNNNEPIREQEKDREKVKLHKHIYQGCRYVKKYPEPEEREQAKGDENHQWVPKEKAGASKSTNKNKKTRSGQQQQNRNGRKNTSKNAQNHQKQQKKQQQQEQNLKQVYSDRLWQQQQLELTKACLSRTLYEIGAQQGQLQFNDVSQLVRFQQSLFQTQQQFYMNQFQFFNNQQQFFNNQFYGGNNNYFPMGSAQQPLEGPWNNNINQTNHKNKKNKG